MKSRLKEEAETSVVTAQNVIANGLATTSAAAVANLPTVENMERTVRNQRIKPINHLPNPITRAAMPVLPPEFEQTLNGERFLLFDSGVEDDNRMLIFAKHQALQLLSTSEDWYNDGTFSVCPEVFFQLYTTQ